MYSWIHCCTIMRYTFIAPRNVLGASKRICRECHRRTFHHLSMWSGGHRNRGIVIPMYILHTYSRSAYASIVLRKYIVASGTSVYGMHAVRFRRTAGIRTGAPTGLDVRLVCYTWSLRCAVSSCSIRGTPTNTGRGFYLECESLLLTVIHSVEQSQESLTLSLDPIS